MRIDGTCAECRWWSRNKWYYPLSRERRVAIVNSDPEAAKWLQWGGCAYAESDRLGNATPRLMQADAGLRTHEDFVCGGFQAKENA